MKPTDKQRPVSIAAMLRIGIHRVHVIRHMQQRSAERYGTKARIQPPATQRKEAA